MPRSCEWLISFSILFDPDLKRLHYSINWIHIDIISGKACATTMYVYRVVEIALSLLQRQRQRFPQFRVGRRDEIELIGNVNSSTQAAQQQKLP